MSLSAAIIDVNGVHNPAVDVNVHELTAAQLTQWDAFVEASPKIILSHCL